MSAKNRLPARHCSVFSAASGLDLIYILGDGIMKITIIGRKCTPRDSFKERAEKKLAKVERFFGEDTEAKITATVEKSAKIVEITVNSGGLIFRSQERSQDLDEYRH